MQFWHQAPVPADNAPYQTLMAEVIEAALFSIALTCGVNQSEIPWLIGRRNFLRQKLRFERNGDFLSKANSDEPSGCDRVTVADQTHRLLSGNNLSAVGRTNRHEVRLRDRNG